jgi:ABC-type cobalamin/Fe3+-siderophores transport system ATPase subunit
MKQLTDKQAQRSASATLAAQDINQRISEERARHQALIRQEQELLRELHAYRHVSYGRFLRRVLLGTVSK